LARMHEPRDGQRVRSPGGLLRYGIEVVRRLEAREFGRPFSWEEEAERDAEPFPGIIEN
jgi:hypothetical protein